MSKLSRWLALFLLTNAPAIAHDWYHDLKKDDGGSCCSDLTRECRRVRAVQHDNGNWSIYVNNLKHPVAPSAVLKRTAPDGMCHACYTESFGIVAIYCFVPCGLGS